MNREKPSKVPISDFIRLYGWDIAVCVHGIWRPKPEPKQCEPER
jgi:hypothetical protein